MFRCGTACVLFAVASLLSHCVKGNELHLGTPYVLTEVNAPLSGDLSPSLSPDGRELYFMGFRRAGGRGISDLWVARRDGPEGPFDVPENLDNINTPGADANPDIAGDGIALYFDSARSGGAGGRDIWMTRRSSLNAPWEPPQPLGTEINTSGFEGRPSVSADGLAIAFDTRHERFGQSIAVAARQSLEDSFEMPMLLDDRFLDGSSPSLSADGLTLFFARLSTGSLWMARRESIDQPFDNPMRLDDTINSLGCVTDPDVSLDGTTLYFSVTSCSSADEFLSQAEIYAVPILSGPILPDYNANGIVEQGDLDLVLLHWGARLRPADLAAIGWHNVLPTGRIDQEELDKVLLNWGSSVQGIGAAAVPEASTVTLGLVALVVLFGMSRIKLTRLALALACTTSLFIANVSYAQFTTVINIPPDVAPSAVGSHTQLNLFDDGEILPFFSAGAFVGANENVEVNISGGTVGEVFQAFGSRVNITGGTVGDYFIAGRDSKVTISGGTIGDDFQAWDGSEVIISGGTIGDRFTGWDGSNVTISGGTLGAGFNNNSSSTSGAGDSTLIVSGGEFLLWGIDRDGQSNDLVPNVLTGSTARLTCFDPILTGTLKDGSPFIFSVSVGDLLTGVTLATVPLAALDSTPMTIDSENAPAGLRERQTLTLVDGGVLGEDFAAVNATLNIAGGSVGDGLELVGSRLTISGGTLGTVRAYSGNEVTILGGEFLVNGDPVSDATIMLNDVVAGTLQDGSPFIFSRREGAGDWLDGARLVSAPLPVLDTTSITVHNENAPNGLRAGQTLTLKDGGVLGENFAAVNATLNIVGGTVGDGLEVAGSNVLISGGRVENGFSAFSGSKIIIAGGTLTGSVNAHSGSEVNFYGSAFSLDGSPITDAALGEVSTIVIRRDGVLSGVLGDGTPLSIGLASEGQPFEASS